MVVHTHTYYDSVQHNTLRYPYHIYIVYMSSNALCTLNTKVVCIQLNKAIVKKIFSLFFVLVKYKQYFSSSSSSSSCICSSN